jgi:hypothetical protein
MRGVWSTWSRTVPNSLILTTAIPSPCFSWGKIAPSWRLAGVLAPGLLARRRAFLRPVSNTRAGFWKDHQVFDQRRASDIGSKDEASDRARRRQDVRDKIWWAHARAQARTKARGARPAPELGLQV